MQELAARKRPLQSAVGLSDPYAVAAPGPDTVRASSTPEPHEVPKMRAVATGTPMHQANGAPTQSTGQFGGQGTPPAGASDDAEEESIYRIMAQHAEHRGPREIAGGPGGGVTDNLARRYIRGRRTEEHVQRTARIPVSDSYICHMCGEKGHHIRECPKRNSSERRTKKIRPATGIPRSWLRLITPEQINQFEDIYCLANGQLAVLTSSYLEHQKQQQAQTTAGGGMSALGGDSGLQLSDLTCPMCNQLLRDAQLIPCCGASVCNQCIRGWPDNQFGSGGVLGDAVAYDTAAVVNCPLCGGLLNPGDIEANTSVQESVELYLRQQSAAGTGQHVSPLPQHMPTKQQPSAPGERPGSGGRSSVKFAPHVKDQRGSGPANGAIKSSFVSSGLSSSTTGRSVPSGAAASMRPASVTGYTPPFVFSATGAAKVIEPPKPQPPSPASAAASPPAPIQQSSAPTGESLVPVAGPSASLGHRPSYSQPAAAPPVAPSPPPCLGSLTSCHDQAGAADELLSTAPPPPGSAAAPSPPRSAAAVAGVRVLTLGLTAPFGAGCTTPPQILAVPQLVAGSRGEPPYNAGSSPVASVRGSISASGPAERRASSSSTASGAGLGQLGNVASAGPGMPDGSPVALASSVCVPPAAARVEVNLSPMPAFASGNTTVANSITAPSAVIAPSIAVPCVVATIGTVPAAMGAPEGLSEGLGVDAGAESSVSELSDDDDDE